MIYESLKLFPEKIRTSDPYCKTLQLTEGTLPGNKDISWGIDPGIHFGLTIIEKEMVHIYSGSLIHDQTPGCSGLMAYRFLKNRLLHYLYVDKNVRMTIEGAAYGVPFRQVELSEIRQGFYLAAAVFPGVINNVNIVPPKTIRKAVFGDGKMQAADVWPLLNHNAADSVAIAMYKKGE